MSSNGAKMILFKQQIQVESMGNGRKENERRRKEETRTRKQKKNKEEEPEIVEGLVAPKWFCSNSKSRRNRWEMDAAL